MNRKIRMTIGSQLADIPLVGVAVNAVCSFFNLSRKEADQMELCVVEAATNSVQHAYRKGCGEVEILLHLQGERLVIDVWDTGESMTRESFKAGLLRSSDVAIKRIEALPESGRGLQIIFSIMDSFEYSTIEGKNRLRMTKQLIRPKGNSSANGPS